MDTTTTFSSSANRYITFILNTRENKQDREIKYMKYWISVFQDTKVSSIERFHVAQARDELLLKVQSDLASSGRKGTGIVAVNRSMARLSHFFSTCIDWGLHGDSNPCTRVRSFKENKGKVVSLTTAEICRLLSECAKSKNKMLLLATLMIITSGARKNEVLTLTYDQIDYGGQCAVLEKSKNGDRAKIGFNDEVMRMLKENRRTTGAIFARPTIDKGFKNAVKRAGLGDLSLHGLRHVYASQLASSGMSLPMLQSALRLKSVGLVQRYAHLSPSVVHSQVLNLTNNWKVKPQDVGMNKYSFPMTKVEFERRMSNA